MSRKILKFNKVEDLINLRRPCEEVTDFDEILKVWANDLISTTNNNNCYGVAAPQIGISIRMICVDVCNVPTIFINPEIIEATGRIKYEERCLSFPGLAVKTKRKSFVRFKYKDVDGNEHEKTVNGVTAVCVQHEINHLDGILLSDQGPVYKVQ